MHEDTRKLIGSVPDLTYSNDFKPLWWDDWYDGELSGICEWKNRLYFFFYIDDEDEVTVDGKTYRERIFSIHELTDEEIEIETYWQQLYELCCGNCNRYDLPHNEFDSRIPENKFYRDFYHARFRLHRKDLTAHIRPALAWFKFR